MKCTFKKYKLLLKKPSGTSRGVLIEKDTYILLLSEGTKTAYGECNLFKGLSCDDKEGYEDKLQEVCSRIPNEKEVLLEELNAWPSIRFGVEMLLKDWEHGGKRVIYPEAVANHTFTIPTNGLIWMGDKDDMKSQIAAKLKEGYTSIKLKIGAIDFDYELELMGYIRKQFSADEVEIRVDANGAFGFEEAKEKLKRIAVFDISYIEQPIKAGQWQEMAALTEHSPVPIALDEELIGIVDHDGRVKLIDTISPQLLILKPALIGGLKASDEWKQLIIQSGGDWVVTSALESNIGLNAIAQYVSLTKTEIPQGLGTGQLYINNFPSPYTVDAKGLHYDEVNKWDLSLL